MVTNDARIRIRTYLDDRFDDLVRLWKFQFGLKLVSITFLAEPSVFVLIYLGIQVLAQWHQQSGYIYLSIYHHSAFLSTHDHLYYKQRILLKVYMEKALRITQVQTAETFDHWIRPHFVIILLVIKTITSCISRQQILITQMLTRAER